MPIERKEVLNKNFKDNENMNEIVRMNSNAGTVSKKEKIHKCVE